MSMNPPSDPALKGPYFGLLALSGVFTLAAAVTLVPWEGAPWPNLWGYKSVCPFAPGATLGCALLAALTCILRNRLVRKERTSVAAPVVVGMVLAALLAWSTVAWVGIKAQYTDAATAATSS